MLTEPEANPGPEGSPEPLDPLDVVVLVVPENASPARIVDVIAEAAARDHAAILVVLPRGADAQTVRRVAAAGANHCAIAPPSTEVFAHMQQARADARHRRRERRGGARIEDDPLDALWRSRAASR